MATHLKDLKCGSKTYYISHSGTDIYWSTFGRGKGTNHAKGLKFKSNDIINNDTGKSATDYEICQKIG